jgi:putative flippase GtrA
MKRVDALASLFIGGMAAVLMLAVSRNLLLPPAVTQHLTSFLLAFPLLTLAAIAIGSFLGRRVRVLYQFTKYALVGGLNFLVDLGVLNLLIALTDTSQGVYASTLKAISFLVAMTWSFFWNKFWTFGTHSATRAGRQFVGFFVVSAIGLLINVAAFAAINNHAALGGDIPPRTWANVAAAGAAVTSILWNFLGYKFVVFRGAGMPGPNPRRRSPA